ncbi:MAG: DUF5050 domain-containing protein [Clostridia bacterium]|nr:DUF5050 domain-containing protein [Clostridia bacterium]
MKKIACIISVIALISLLSACGGEKIEPEATPVPAPKPLLEFTVDTEKQNPSGDYYAEASEEFLERANFVLKEATDPYHTVFENALGLYEYLTRNISFDENGGADTMSVLMGTSANQIGFTKTYQYLLHQIGAEAHIATANDESICWVMAMLADGFYHFDPAAEAKLSGGQSLKYFAMNDEYRWASAKVDGWYLGSDDLGGRYEAPKNELMTYVFLQNITLGYGVDYESDVLYFSDNSKNNEIMKYNYQTAQEELVYEKSVGALAYHKGILYYSDVNQRNQLFELNLTTGEEKPIDSVFVTRMMIRNKHLIYFDDVSSSEKAITLS